MGDEKWSKDLTSRASKSVECSGRTSARFLNSYLSNGTAEQGQATFGKRHQLVVGVQECKQICCTRTYLADDVGQRKQSTGDVILGWRHPLLRQYPIPLIRKR